MSAHTRNINRLFLSTHLALIFVLLVVQHCHAKLTIDPPIQEIEEKINSQEYLAIIFCDETINDEDCQIQIEDIGDQFKTGIKGFPGIEALVTANQELIEKYGLNELPVVAFFRTGIPILYVGDDIETHELPAWMNLHRDRHAVALADSNFEHDTQATTGATTGDWFIMFYQPGCVQMLATWENIAIWLAQDKVVARVDTSANPELKERFNELTECPSFAMLSRGKLYTFKDDVLTPKPMLDFARKGFQSEEGVPVPRPIEVSFFSTLGAAVISPIVGGSICGRLCVLGGGILVALLVVMVVLNKRRKQRAKFD